MAVTQFTDLKVKVEPKIVTPEYEFGPSDYMAANAVLLTANAMRRLGASCPQIGTDFVANLWVFGTVDTVPTAFSLVSTTVAGSFWDPVTRVAYDFDSCAIAGDGSTGCVVLTIADDLDVTPGLYQFEITATRTSVYTLMSGWIEFLPGRPEEA